MVAKYPYDLDQSLLQSDESVVPVSCAPHDPKTFFRWQFQRLGSPVSGRKLRDEAQKQGTQGRFLAHRRQPLHDSAPLLLEGEHRNFRDTSRQLNDDLTPCSEMLLLLHAT